MNDFFSFRRFGRLLRYDFTMLWREPAIYVGIVAALVAVVLLTDVDTAWYELSLVALDLFVGLLGLLYLSTHVFKDMRRKTHRMKALVLPASRVEKYISRLIIFVVLPAVAFFCLRSLTDIKASSSAFSALRHFIINPYMMMYQLMLSVLYGTLFGRFAIIKGNILLSVLQLFAASFISFDTDFQFLEPIIEYCEENSQNIFHLEMAYSAAISVFCLVVSFLVFRRKNLKYNRYI
ncbi:MAG: hypothetical protein J6Y82_01950 [Bacteroidales bacterium]|nr:hypothetical protein [Bacteroidales bacterium]